MSPKIFRVLADLRFAISLLLLISLFSILGTIIEQDQPIEIYKANYPLANPILGFLSWDTIIKLGLDHVYKTWLFSLLIFLFGFSLISCTFLQQIPSLKISRRCQFFRTHQQFSKLKIFTTLTTLPFNKILLKIKAQQYSIFHQKNIIYCYKGLIGRIASILVHFSIILVLAGTIIGSLFGFKAQEIIPETETFHIQNILANTGQLTFITKKSLRVNDFWVTYNQNNTIAQFYSDISILDSSGNETKRKTISVNSPLVDDNVYYYQTDWNLVGLRIKSNTNKFSEYPLINLNTNNNPKTWLTWISDKQFSDIGIIILLDNLEGYCSVYEQMGQFLGNIELHEKTLFNYPITAVEILNSTGLQIKADPGIPFIYVGFLALMGSISLSYITYSQIWILTRDNQFLIGGTTNRAIFEFELEFFKIIQ